MLHDAVHAPRMYDLISISRLLDASVKVMFDDVNSHIVLPGWERIHARRANGLFMLNYLVPLCDVKQEYSDDGGAAARVVRRPRMRPLSVVLSWCQPLRCHTLMPYQSLPRPYSPHQC